VHVLGSTRAARQRRDLEETEPNRDVAAVISKTDVSLITNTRIKMNAPVRSSKLIHSLLTAGHERASDTKPALVHPVRAHLAVRLRVLTRQVFAAPAVGGGG